MAEERFLLRASRNTLLDIVLNEVGGTYPLTDLPVKAESDFVFYDEPAKLVLDYSQPDVKYLVYEDIEHRSPQNGTGAELTLLTLPLKVQAHAFRVKAIKRYGKTLDSTLLQTILITIGVNRGLEIVAEKPIITYGEKAALIIKNTQKNARYAIFFEHNAVDTSDMARQIVLEDNVFPDELPPSGLKEQLPDNCKRYLLSKSKLSENGGDIRIETQYCLRETIDLKVWVFDEDTRQAGILLKTTPISVTPNVNLPATWYSLANSEDVNNTGAINYSGKVGIRLQQTQKSANYFICLGGIDTDAPDRSAGELLTAMVAGTGAQLDIPLPMAIKEDTLVTIRVNKPTLDLASELIATVMIAAYPDANRKFSLITGTSDDERAVIIRIDNPQRGIIYQLRDAETKKAVSEPFFYHRNQGTGHMRVSKNREGLKSKNTATSEYEWLKGQFVVGSCNQGNEPENAKVLLTLNKKNKPGAVEITAIKSTTGFVVVIGVIDLNDQ
ncbi:hypothetical protein ACFFGT_27890 [Mucilaginibacter angelicae]|uniref:Uncharacterized protein n=1 Tax=Mucilaginibacter angelicae TaxID=869718 RepID=A0ABV6LF24_9SPHI